MVLIDRSLKVSTPLTLDEVRASSERHRSSLVLRCIEDHLAGQRFPLSLVYTDAAITAQTPAIAI